MTIALLTIVAVLAVALGVLAVAHFRTPARSVAPGAAPAPGSRRLLFPFVAHALAPRALDVALRLARAEEATLVPVFLAQVPLYLPLDAALPRQSAVALPLQEAIEQRAAAFGVGVDARIERGRSYRHALRQTFEHERFDRIVVAAAASSGPGFHPDDVAWVLEHAPGEIVVMRPDPEGRADPPIANHHPVRRRRPPEARPPAQLTGARAA